MLQFSFSHCNTLLRISFLIGTTPRAMDLGRSFGDVGKTGVLGRRPTYRPCSVPTVDALTPLNILSFLNTTLSQVSSTIYSLASRDDRCQASVARSPRGKLLDKVPKLYQAIPSFGITVKYKCAGTLPCRLLILGQHGLRGSTN